MSKTFNILLISPPIFDFYNTAHRKEPLGLLYQMEALQRAGHTVELYDATRSRTVKKQKTPPEMEYLSEFYYPDKSPSSLHSSYKRFGDSFRKIVAYIEENPFDLIGISSLFSAYHPDVERLIVEIKKVTEAPIVVGGGAIDAEKEYVSEHTDADYLIYGGSTSPIVALADALTSDSDFESVPALIYKKKDTVFINKADDAPPWDGDIIPKRDYFRTYRGEKVASIIFSTGCRFSCSFCSIHRTRTHHVKPLAMIKRELQLLFDSGATLIDIEDDDIFSDKKQASELLDILTDFHKKGLSFAAFNGLTARTIEPFAEKLVGAGFIKLDLALVSASSVVASSANRPHGLVEIESIVKKVNRAIEIEVFIIPGLPGSSLIETEHAMHLLHNLGVKVGLSPLYLLPGIPLFEQIGIPEKRRLCRGSALYPFTHEERKEVVKLLRMAGKWVKGRKLRVES